MTFTTTTTSSATTTSTTMASSTSSTMAFTSASASSSAFRTTTTSTADASGTSAASRSISPSTATASAVPDFSSTSGAPNGNDPSDPSDPSDPDFPKTVLFALIALAVLICCCVLLVLLLCRRKRKVDVQEPFLRSRISSGETSLAELISEKYDIPDHEITFGKELGKGSFGTVLLCKMHGDDVAVKCMAKWGGDEIETEALSKTFLREFRVSFALTSPRIVRVYGICSTVPDCLCIVLEYCGGGALRQRLDELGGTPPAIEASMTWGFDIALGMEYLHQYNIMHRDLKSANVLLVPTQQHFRAKVADFGLATAKESAEETVGKRKSESLSGTGSMMGTVSGSPQWMSPEAINGQRTFSSDVYAYGIVLWEVSTTLKPYAGQGIVTILYRVSVEQARPSPLPEPIPGSGDEQHPLAELMTKCWDHDEDARPGFVEVVRVMRDIIESGQYACEASSGPNSLRRTTSGQYACEASSGPNS